MQNFDFSNAQAVWDIIARNPQAQKYVESLVKMDQMQMVAQGSPNQGVNQFAQPQQNWHPTPNYAHNQQTTAPVPIPAQQPQGGQQSMGPMGMMQEALQIVTEFRGYFDGLNKNMKATYDSLEETRVLCKDLSSKVDDLSKENLVLKKSNDEMVALVKKFTSAKG